MVEREISLSMAVQGKTDLLRKIMRLLEGKVN